MTPLTATETRMIPDAPARRARRALALLLALAAGPALAEPATIFQAGKKFSQKAVTIRAGEAVTFVNDDDNVHNVHSQSAGHAFDLGAQQPGEQGSHVFATPGEVDVRCAIHPRMRLKVTVE